VARAVALDPGGTLRRACFGMASLLTDASVLPSTKSTASAPSILLFRGSIPRLASHAVYASQSESPLSHARLATEWGPALSGQQQTCRRLVR
jgi:hypothetical protein